MTKREMVERVCEFANLGIQSQRERRIKYMCSKNKEIIEKIYNGYLNDKDLFLEPDRYKHYKFFVALLES